MRRVVCCLLPAACCLLMGCQGGPAALYDEFTSRDFKFKSLYTRTDPLVVLRDSNDGDKRAKALRSLQEPAQRGGSQQEQDVIVKILMTAASNERHPLCRLAAIQTLAKFKDPRAVQGLTEAFYNANSFTPEMATIIRCQAITALGQTGNPAAVELLVRVVREPEAEGTDLERQQALDVRVAAARALGNFNTPRAIEALEWVLKTEKDVALRDRAEDSLAALTGRKRSALTALFDGGVKQAGYRMPTSTPPGASAASSSAQTDSGPEPRR